MDEVLVQGFLIGGVYALIALGFCLIFKSSQVLNLAYGEQILLVSYFLTWLLDQAGLDLWLAFIVLFVFGGLLGIAVERLAIRRLIGQSMFSILMMTLMMGIFLRGVAILRWSGAILSYPFTPDDMILIGGVHILPAALYGFAAALAVFVLLLLVFKYTKFGLTMRVVAADSRKAQIMGIRVKRIFSLSWLMSGALSAVSAILVGMLWLVAPENADLGLGKGLPVLLLGGMDSIPGALAGGLIVGLAESLAGYWFGQVQVLVPWIIMLLILLIRPWGLFGRKRIERI